MRRGLVLGLLLGWLLGVGSGLLYVAFSGGWYEYVWERSVSGARDLVNEERWHIVPDQSNEHYLRRPRFRLP